MSCSILLVSHCLNESGAPNSLFRHACYLRDAGYRVDVWSLDCYRSDARVVRRYEEAGFRPRVVENERGAIRRAFEEHGEAYDLIVCNTLCSWQCVDELQRLGVPLVWFVRETARVDDKYARDARFAEVFSNFYNLYAPSGYAADRLRKYNRNVRVVENGVPDGFSGFGNIRERGRTRFGFLGSVIPIKGVDSLVSAFLRLRQECSEVELVLAGRASGKYADRLRAMTKGDPCVTWLGQVQGEAKGEFFSRIDVLCVPSLEESSGLSVMEGAMRGKALITTDHVGARYLLEDFPDSIVKAGDTAALLDAMRRLARSSEGDLRRRQQAARNAYCERATTEVERKNVLRMVADNLGRRPQVCHAPSLWQPPREFPLEPDVHDFFDAFLDEVFLGDELPRFLRWVGTANGDVRKDLAAVVDERLLQAFNEGRLPLGRFGMPLRLSLRGRMFRAWLRRRQCVPANFLRRIQCKFLGGPHPQVWTGEWMDLGAAERPVTVVVPVYNGFDALARLCASLFDHTGTMHEIVFVDDASPDPRIAPFLLDLAERHANVRIVTNEKNLGFPGTVNRGVAAGSPERDFVLLNTDTEVPAGWIPRLFAPLWHDRRIASTMPVTCTCPTAGTSNPGVVTQERLRREGVASVDRIVSRIVPVARFNQTKGNLGFCLAISRTAWRRVGPLAADVFGFGYHEEADWCARARYRFGYRHLVVPNVLVAHWHNGSFSPERRRLQLERNRGRLRSRNPMRSFDANPFYVLSRRFLERAIREAGL